MAQVPGVNGVKLFGLLPGVVQIAQQSGRCRRGHGGAHVVAARQNVKSGGSGPGCSAAVLCGHILPRLLRGSQKRVLFVATGALMSQTTFLQKESIPAVAHLVELRAPEKEK